jgi:hypothetical protein
MIKGCAEMLYMLVSIVRSGSTAVLHALSQHSDVRTATNTLRSSLQGAMDRPHYAALDELRQAAGVVVYRASIGGLQEVKTTYSPFSSEHDIMDSRPLFLFRDPLPLFGSWAAAGLTNVDQFLRAYQRLAQLYLQCRAIAREAGSDGSIVEGIRLESLVAAPQRSMTHVLARWDLAYQQSVVDWTTTPGVSTVTAEWSDAIRVREKVEREFADGKHTTLSSARGFHAPAPRPLPPDAIRRIEHATEPIAARIRPLVLGGDI